MQFSGRVKICFLPFIDFQIQGQLHSLKPKLYIGIIIVIYNTSGLAYLLFKL